MKGISGSNSVRKSTGAVEINSLHLCCRGFESSLPHLIMAEQGSHDVNHRNVPESGTKRKGLYANENNCYRQLKGRCRKDHVRS